MRICSRCKNPGEFRKSSRGPCKACDKDIRFRDRDKIATWMKKYRVDNREEIAVRAKRRYLNNRSRFWCTGTVRSHKRRGFKVEFAPVELWQIAKDTTHCGICNCRLIWVSTTGQCMLSTPTLDRINNNGVLTLKNTQIICMQCNTTKGSRTMKEFISYCAMVANKLGVKQYVKSIRTDTQLQ